MEIGKICKIAQRAKSTPGDRMHSPKRADILEWVAKFGESFQMK